MPQFRRPIHLGEFVFTRARGNSHPSITSHSIQVLKSSASPAEPPPNELETLKILSIRNMQTYRGAGILFIALHPSCQPHLLLARRKSGIWSIPGGGRSHQDQDAASTAWRETHEEFGHPPDPGRLLFTQRYPFSLLGFDWTTFVIELPSIPEASIFPSPDARDFHREFTDAHWFPLNKRPKRTHLLLYPILLRLRTCHLHPTKPRFTDSQFPFP